VSRHPSTPEQREAERQQLLGRLWDEFGGQEKRCGRCGETWPADAEFFRPRTSQPHRLLCWCRACEAEQRRQARSRSKS
jgi:hypothetical protein